MLEISIFCVILFAMAYWATLFVMGRRADVLHGEFVEAGAELAEAAIPVSASMPIFPPKPVTGPRLPAEPEKPANAEALQSLLASLKQELKNASQL